MGCEVSAQKIGICGIQERTYQIPQLQEVIIKAHKDLHSKDLFGKKRYFFPIVNFIFEWLRQSMQNGKTLHEAQCIVIEDLKLACKKYPVGKIQKFCFNIKIRNRTPFRQPNLLEGIPKLTKQTFIDRVKQLCLSSKSISYQFNKQMQTILQKEGGYKFKASYKSMGMKAYMRILTKILQGFFTNDGSKQVYTNLDHHFWTPILAYFNKIIDQNIDKIKIQVYDWIRCRVFYKKIQEVQKAYKRLKLKVKNRINTHTRDILINLKYQNQYAQIQLALYYEASSYQFNHKLYQLTRQKLGVAYSCFTILLNQANQQSQINIIGVQTKSGYIKRTLLREHVEEGFQRLTIQDAKQQYSSIKKLLEQWDVVALKTGTIKGGGFEQKISTENYGPQVQTMMIIKKKSDSKLENWLNWQI